MRNSSRWAGAMLALAMLQCGSPAGAQEQGAPTTSSFLAVGAKTQPINGWTVFCQRYFPECETKPLEPRTMALDADAWSLLQSVNAEINDTVESVTDADHWGIAEQWDYPLDGRGDCEDYVLAKRKRLMELGAPRQALLITVVLDTSGAGHAILIVRTDRGDFVLDNLTSTIKPWSQTGYRYLKMQSQEDPNTWLGITTDETTPVAASARPPRAASLARLHPGPRNAMAKAR